MFNIIEWIFSGGCDLAEAALKSVNSDSDDTESIIPGFDDLMVNPFPIGGPFADQDNRASAALHLIFDPAFDPCIMIDACGD